MTPCILRDIPDANAEDDQNNDNPDHITPPLKVSFCFCSIIVLIPHHHELEANDSDHEKPKQNV
jgi:hypothetical protein